MERRTFVKAGCMCGALSLIDPTLAASAVTNQQSDDKKNVPQDMNHKQVKNIIKYIDSSQDEQVKEDIFSQLGYECFYSRKLDGWIGQYVGNVQAFLDRINVEKKSKYWESLEFNEDKTALKLTGRKVEGCACSFADTPQPPMSLCNYCCKNFQQQLFGMLLGQKVNVEITKSYLHGDESCDTLIYIV